MDEFNPERVERVSKAATCMCQWVLAMDAHYKVMKMVRPRQLALQRAENQLLEKQQRLADAQSKLDAILDSLLELKVSARAGHVYVFVVCCWEQMERWSMRLVLAVHM